MDPIRPIGPVERDLERVERVTRLSPDARKERREPLRKGAHRDGTAVAGPVQIVETDK